jgi:signal transduction histidine kinase
MPSRGDPERTEGSKAPLRPRLLFTVATVLALSSTIQSWRLEALSADQTWALTLQLMAQLMVLNTVYWYVPALLTPTIVGIAQRYRLGHTRWARMLSVHVASAFAYSFVHTALMLITKALLFPNGGRGPVPLDWWSHVQRQYLTQLDWMLATYFCLVALGHAIAYWREAEGRAISAARLQARLAEAQLQPLVENAVRHRIAPRARQGRIDVRVFRHGGQLRLEVQDSGDGLAPDKLLTLNDGVGLGNTRARLSHLYGADHGFAFENLTGGGFQVSVGIPFRTGPAAVDAVRAEVA